MDGIDNEPADMYDMPYMSYADQYGGPLQTSGTGMAGGDSSGIAGGAAAGASGIGGLLALAPKLIGAAQQRKYQREALRIQQEQAAQRHAQNLENLNLEQAQGQLAYSREVPAATSSFAARGLLNSSVKNTGLNDMQMHQNLQQDAINRNRALEQSGWEAQNKLWVIQKKAQHSAVLWDTVAQVGNAVGGVAGMAAGI